MGYLPHNVEQLAQQLTETSVQRNATTHETYSEDLATELLCMSDDSADTVDGNDRKVVEYWGADDEGNEWRVHLTRLEEVV